MLFLFPFWRKETQSALSTNQMGLISVVSAVIQVSRKQRNGNTNLRKLPNNEWSLKFETLSYTMDVRGYLRAFKISHWLQHSAEADDTRIPTLKKPQGLFAVKLQNPEVILHIFE